MPGEKGSYRIIYGNALPTVCSPNTGDVFALTIDGVAQGRGLYYCFTANQWERLARGGEGAALPPVCDVGDTFIINAGPDAGLYICTTINVWNKVEGDYSGDNYNITTNPTVFTDFTDTRYWIPILNDQAYTQAFDANGLMTVTGVGPQDLNNGLYFTGVMSRLRLFPSATTHRLQYTVTFDNWITAAAPAVATFFGFGSYIWNDGNDIEAIIYGNQNNGANASFFSAVSNTMATVALNGLNVAFGIGGAGAAIRSIYDWNLPASRLWAITNYQYNIGAGFVDLVLAASRPIGYSLEAGGIRFGLGALAKTREAAGSARLTSFSLDEGRMLAL